MRLGLGMSVRGKVGVGIGVMGIVGVRNACEGQSRG